MSVSSIKKGFVNLYHAKVKEVGAIRTGALYDSIECVITMDKSGPSVEITGINYLPFVDDGTRTIEPRHITDKWRSDPQFDVYMSELVDIWMEKYLG